jgi:hypothetical protein
VVASARIAWVEMAVMPGCAVGEGCWAGQEQGCDGDISTASTKLAWQRQWWHGVDRARAGNGGGRGARQ